MAPELVAVVVVVGAAVLVLMGLTAVGGRRRGQGVVLALTAGVFFPVTWVVWYLRDERPYRLRRATPSAHA